MNDNLTNNISEPLIEKGTAYALKNGTLTLYETNCSCKDIQFHFNQFVMTQMMMGHKTIRSENLKFEFFPGTFFIPEKGKINTVDIPNASLDYPTKCLVLELNAEFIEEYYTEIMHLEDSMHYLYSKNSVSDNYFISNDKLLVKAFERLYKLQHQDHSPSKALIEELVIKEILLRVFQSEGLLLLKTNFKNSVKNQSIRAVTEYISANIDKKLTAKQLCSVANMSTTTLFTKFKTATGYTPVEWIRNERIKKAKILMQKGQLNLKDIAYKCGFNSYEYFCKSFKKLEQIKPSEYRKTKNRLTL